MRESDSFDVRVRGPLACFTRPELKVERVSYEVMTPSAARGILEAVLWKPAIRWRIHQIAVLSAVRWIAVRRNEVQSIMSPSRPEGIVVDDDRTQRHTVALRDVDYVIRASFELSERAGPADNVPKFVDMFRRRLERGEQFQQPCLGCREFAAEVLPARGAPDAIERGVSRPLGPMFWDFDWAEKRKEKEPPTPLYFNAWLRSGVLSVPTLADARRANRGEGS